MEQQGLKSIVSIDKLAVMGFVEVLKDLIFFINLKIFPKNEKIIPEND